MKYQVTLSQSSNARIEVEAENPMEALKVGMRTYLMLPTRALWIRGEVYARDVEQIED